MCKRILSIILAVVFCLTAISVPTFANVAPKVVYYVGETAEETVSGLRAGDSYSPNRMPGTSAPEGKYFAGWQDEEGNFVLKNGITLKDGENKLIACYKSYPEKLNVSLPSKGNGAIASFDENQENYLNYMSVSNGYLNSETVTENGETYTRFYNSNTWASREIFTFVDESGAAVQLKPATKYHIAVTYKKPVFKSNVIMEVVTGLLPEKRSGVGLADRYIQSISSVSETTDTSVQRKWNYNWNSNGYYEWYVGAESTQWQTSVYTVTTGDFNGYLPVAMMGIYLVDADEIFIKGIEITVDGYVPPPGEASVEYYVDGKVENTVTGVTCGDLYTANYMPKNLPEGKYFAGWTDKDGNFVERMTLQDGTNSFFAKLVDYPGMEYASFNFENFDIANKVYLPSVDANGENYSAFSNVSGGYGVANNVVEEGYNALLLSTAADWGQNKTLILADENGIAYQPKPLTEYRITVTYKVPQYGNSIGFNVVSGINFDSRLNNKEPSKFGQNVAAVSEYDEKGITVDYQWNSFMNGGYYRTVISAAANEWKTITYNLKTGDFNGFVPALSLVFNFSGKKDGVETQLVIREIEIYEKNYSAPAVVNYYYGDDLMLKDDSAVIGGNIREDIAPEGFVFVDWYSDKALSEKAKDYVNKKELNLYGKFIPNDTKIDITYKNGDEVIKIDNVKVLSKLWNGKNAVSGKAFYGWFTDKELTKPYESLCAEITDLTLYGKFADYITQAEYSAWPTKYDKVNVYTEYNGELLLDFSAGGYSYKDSGANKVDNPNNQLILNNSCKWFQGGGVIIYDPQTGNVATPKPSSTYEISVTFTVPRLDATSGTVGIGFGMDKTYYKSQTNTTTDQYATLYTFTEAFNEPVTVNYTVYVPENPGNSILPCFFVSAGFNGPKDSTKETVLSYVAISNISIKEVSTNVDVTFDGASVLTNEAQSKINGQAIRVYYSYTLDADGKITDTKGNKYAIKERGVLFKAEGTSNAALVLDTVGKDGVYGIHKYKNLEECWQYDQESGKVTFSARVTDLAIGDTRKIQFRGYVVLDDNTVCYTDTVSLSVADITRAIDTDTPKPAEKEKIAIMLVIGQSNAHNSGYGEEKTLAAGTNGLWQISALPTTTDYGAVYMSEKGAVTSLSPIYEYSSNFVDTIGGFAPAYAARWYELTGQRVVVLRLSKGATSLAEWQKDANTNMSHYKELSGDSSDMGYDNGYYLYARAVNAFNETYEALKENYDITTAFYAWNQGESEEKFTAENATIYTDALYEEYFTKLHNDLLNDCPGLQYGTIIAVRSCTNTTHSAGKWWQSGNSTNAKRAQYRIASRRDDVFMVSWYTETCNKVVNTFAETGLNESVWGGNWDMVPSIKGVLSTGNMHYTQLNNNIFGKEAAENFYASLNGKVNFTGVNVRDNDNNQIVFFKPDGKGSGSITYDGTVKYKYLQIRPEDASCTYDFSLSVDKESKTLVIDLYTDGSHHASGDAYVSQYGEIYWDKLTAEGITTLNITCNIH